MARDEYGPSERVCPICKKVFMARATWAYQTGYNEKLVYYCSWNHLRQAEREGLKIKQERKIVGRPHVKLTDKEKDTIMQMLKEGRPVKEIAEKIKKKPQTVFYYKDKMIASRA